MSDMPSAEAAQQFMYDAMVYQRIDLTGPWKGWKIRAQYLVSPDKERIPVRELVGLLIHYRGRFGHKLAKPAAAAGPSNVVPFASAAVATLQARQKVA